MDGDILGDTDGLALGDIEIETLGDTLGLTDGLALGLIETLGEMLGLAEGLIDTEVLRPPPELKL